MNLKNQIINSIIDIEGGYTNDENDSGGETKYGITKATAIANGYMGDIKKLDRETAYQIYLKSFWNKLYLDEMEKLSTEITKEIADTAINMGKPTATIFFQRCLNILNNREKYYKDIKLDGIVGKKTILSLKNYLIIRGKEGEEVLVKMLNVLQGAKYIGLAESREKDEKFIYGWFKNRVRI